MSNGCKDVKESNKLLLCLQRTSSEIAQLLFCLIVNSFAFAHLKDGGGGGGGGFAAEPLTSKTRMQSYDKKVANITKLQKNLEFQQLISPLLCSGTHFRRLEF